MDTKQAIKERHSVRAYTDQRIEGEVRETLDRLINKVNEQSGLRVSVKYDDPDGFDSKLAHYGSFRNVKNYVILAGPKDEDIDERCGYYGERIVLEAQKMGLNTCWVALTFNKGLVKSNLKPEEKLCMVIAIGYGETSGHKRKSKTVADVVASKGKMPGWFRAGAQAALLAPTAMNQQKFKMGMHGGEPVILVSGAGFYTKVDLGIVKYHFEVASGHKVY